MKRLFTVLALIAAVSVSVLAQDDDAKYAADLLKKGTVAPAFKIPDTKGVQHSLADFKGSYVVLDFWATWCPDCRKDVPKMKELYATYASSNIAFVGISLDTDAAVHGGVSRNAEGLIVMNGFLTLTESGRAIAEKIYERHRVLTKILMTLGVDEATATADACKMEHDISDATFAAIKAHLAKYDN